MNLSYNKNNFLILNYKILMLIFINKIFIYFDRIYNILYSFKKIFSQIIPGWAWSSSNIFIGWARNIEPHPPGGPNVCKCYTCRIGVGPNQIACLRGAMTAVFNCHCLLRQALHPAKFKHIFSRFFAITLD